MSKLPTYDKVPRHKKFDGKWYIITDIAFSKKYGDIAKKTCKKVYDGSCKMMKYRHKSGSIEYAIYTRNPKGRYGKPPRK